MTDARYGCFNPAGQCATAPGLDAYNARFGCLAFANPTTGCEPNACPPTLCDNEAPSSIWPATQTAFYDAMSAAPSAVVNGACGPSAAVTTPAGQHATGTQDSSLCAMFLLRHIVRVLNTTIATGCTGPCLGTDVPTGTTGCCSVAFSTSLAPLTPAAPVTYAFTSLVPQLTFAGATTSPVLAKYQNYFNALLYCHAASCSCGVGRNSTGVAVPCSGSGTCAPTSNNSWACACNAGASGVACETTAGGTGTCPVAWCARTASTLPCSGGNHGVCISGTCTCFPPWSGAACDQHSCPSVDGEECSGNGVCSEFKMCECTAPHTNGPAGACECVNATCPSPPVTPDNYTPVPGGGAGVTTDQDVIFGTPGGNPAAVALQTVVVVAGVVLGLLIAAALLFGLKTTRGGTQPAAAAQKVLENSVYIPTAADSHSW